MLSCPDPLLLGPQVGELLEGPLQTSRNVYREHLAGLDPDNLCGVARLPQDKDERPWRHTNLALAECEERLPVEDVQELIATRVNMVECPGLQGARRYEEPDLASCFLASRFQPNGVPG